MMFAAHLVPLCLQSGDIPGLVRLLLLEAVQQPLPHSLLAPGLRDAWQQQQHLDLARAARSSSSSSNPVEVWMPQLLSALLGHSAGWLPEDNADAIHQLMQLLQADGPKQQQQQHRSSASRVDSSTAAAAADRAIWDGAKWAALQAEARYILACVSSPGCRYSLTCWVLAWHAALLQQAGDCSSAADR
jgi:hypothetical protein